MQKHHIWQIFGAIGILIGFLVTGYSWATTVSDIPPIVSDSRLGVGFGLLITFLSMLVFVYKLYGNFLWSEPEINVIPAERGEDEYKDGEFYKIARLEIFNNEEMEITKCYAILECADDIYSSNGKAIKLSLIPSLGNTHKPDRIVWHEERYMSEECEITIPVKDSRHLDVADMLRTFHYNLCGGSVEANWMIGAPLHTVRLRIDGQFNGRAMKPIFFEGYIYAANHMPADETYVKKFGDDKIKKAWQKTADQITYLKMIFKKGDWTKDKEIKEYMNIKEYEFS